LYICGGFGGAACALSQLLQGKAAPTLEFPSQFADEQYAASASYYETTTAVKLRQILNTTSRYKRFVEYSVDSPLLCEFFRAVGVRGLNNGLSARENETLFETPSLDEIQMLVLTGLTRLFTVSQVRKSSYRKSQSLSDVAFKRAIRSASRPRSPLINDFPAVVLVSADELRSLENELFLAFGNEYLEARQLALQKCAPEILEQFASMPNVRSLLSLDLAALNWIPAAGDVSKIAEFLAELCKAKPAVAEREEVRRHLSTELISSNRPSSPTPTPITRAAAMHLDGREQGRLSKAVHSAFPSPNRLRIALATQLDDDIYNYAGLDDAYPDIRLKMISAYNALYKIAQLVSALLDENPTNGELLEFAWRHQILKRPSGALQQLGVDDGSLERMLDPARGFTDVGQMLQRLGQVVNSVCQISYPLPGEIFYGTGFLIGNSTVLTKWHVVERVTAGIRKDVRFKFDYRTGQDGITLSPGVEVPLVDSEDWLVDRSPYDPADLAIRTIDEEKALDRSLENLDYAVLRVAGEPGNKPVGVKASANAEPRGCLSLDEVIDVPAESQSAIWCFQHPYEKGQSLPQQVDWNKPSLLGSNSNKSRVWYNINTRPGSSGSPIFTNKIQLCALHQAGGWDWPAPGQYLYNRGIPLALIRDLLAKRGKLGEIK
jgi:hypothetical protein